MSLDAFNSIFFNKADLQIAKVNSNVAKYETLVARFNELHPEATLEAANLGAGEIFANIFPEKGGFNGGDPSSGLSINYINLLEYGDPFKSMVKELYQISDSNRRLEKAKKYLEQVTKYKADGPDAYFLKVKQAISSVILKVPKPEDMWDKIMGGEDIESIAHQFEPELDGPSGLLSSPELIAALREDGYPLLNNTKSNTINESDDIDSKDDTDYNEADSINPEEVIDEIEEDDVETESSNSVESIAPVVESNVTPILELEDKQVVKSDVSDNVSSSVINDVDESITNNISKSVINNNSSSITKDTEDEDEDDTITLADIEAVKERFGMEDDSVSTDDSINTDDILNETDDSVNTDDIVNVSSVSSVINDTSIEDSNTESIGDTSINTTNTAINSDITSVNPKDTEDEDETITLADIEAVKERFGMEDDSVNTDDILNETDDSVNTDDILNETNISNTVNTSESKIKNIKDSVTDNISNTTDVTKSKIGLDRGVAPINTPPVIDKPDIAPTDSGVSMTEVVKTNSEPPSTASTIDNSTSSDTSSTQSSSSNQSMSSPTDMSAVESRLRKIENLLSGTLDVKIIE